MRDIDCPRNAVLVAIIRSMLLARYWERGLISHRGYNSNL